MNDPKGNLESSRRWARNQRHRDRRVIVLPTLSLSLGVLVPLVGVDEDRLANIFTM